MDKSNDASNLLLALAARKPGLEQFEPAWRLIEDVLSGRVKRRAARPAGFFNAAQDSPGWSSPYLPKGRLESPSEYSQRVELTPFFPETPRILSSRLGTLLRTPPVVDGISSENLNVFLSDTGRYHARFEDLAAQAACLAQVYGFCAAMLDRDPLPLDAQGRDTSAAEAAQRALGRPYLALYAAPDVLDWQYAPDGRLAWVKFGEREVERAAWDLSPREQFVYRIVDREAVHCFRAFRNSDGKWEVIAEPKSLHGFGRVPVVFCHPLPGRDGIGRPLLERSAEADIAALRILSDLVWDLFVLGNPILTLKTNRPDGELERIGVGASRYVPLRAGRPGMDEEEKLEFVQLDPTGLELLFRAHELFSAQAARQAGSGGHEAVATPREQSGISRAWAFKTGEERVLYMLARALEPFLSKCLGLAAEALGVNDSPRVKLADTFDIQGPAETVDLAAKALQVARDAGLEDLAHAAARKMELALGGS